jgi:hypothetical protein
MEIQVQSGLPIPPKKTKGTKNNYPFHTMNVGDSFLIANSPYKNMEHIRCGVMTAAKRYGKSNNTIFTSRKEADGIRVWRKS